MATDWCEHSVYLPAGTRREINAVTDDLVGMAVSRVAERLRDVRALCVGGSLARREPAVRSGWPPRLVSDIDVIAVLGADGRTDTASVLAAERAVSGEITQAKVGLVAVAVDHVERASSFFAVDLSAAMRLPVRGSVSERKAPLRLRRRDRIELIVHQVSSVLLQSLSGAATRDYLLRPDAGYHTVKLPLECLRALLAEPNGDGCSYASVFEMRHDALCRSVLPASLVERLIRRRELFGADRTRLPDGRGVVTRVLAAVFDTVPDTLVVVQRILDEVAALPDPLSVYQATCLVLFLFPRLAYGFVESVAAPALKSLWSGASKEELTDAASTALASLAAMPAHAVARRPDAVLRLLRPIRLDYYRLLGDHIFGVQRRPDYTDIG